VLLATLAAAFLASAAESSSGEPALTAYPDPAFNAIGTTRDQIVGVVQDEIGPVGGVEVTVTVTGANSASGECTTNDVGLCQVQYIGIVPGVDTITATAEVNGQPLQDQTTTEWAGQPGNDDFSDAVEIQSLPFADAVPNVAATIEPQEPPGCGSMVKTVWYRLSVDAPTSVGASTGDSGFPTSLAIYRGSSLGNLDLLDCDQFGPGPPPPAAAVPAGGGVLTSVKIAADLVPGSTYYIQVGGSGNESGEFALSVYTTGSVSGRLFLDLNVNGEFDGDDEGIGEHLLTLTSDSASFELYTLGDGNFTFLVPAGEYLLEANPIVSGTLCIDGAFPFNPASLHDCISPQLPRVFTTQNPQQVSVTSSQVTKADVIVRVSDGMTIVGIALLEDGVAPEGTEITAMKGAVECGVSQATPAASGEANYELTIIGAGEKAGCAQPGDSVVVKVGENQAVEEIIYESTPNSFKIQTLSALGDRAWYWAQQVLLPGVTPPSGMVEAWIDGTLCGEAILATQSSFSQKVSGFSSLVVESATSRPGCGSPGTTVSFMLNGTPVGMTAWDAGLTYLRLNLPGAIVLGDLDCSTVVNVIDVLVALRLVAKLTTHTPCSPFAFDANCDLASNSLDALVVLRWIAQLPINQPQGCPEIGTAG